MERKLINRATPKEESQQYKNKAQNTHLPSGFFTVSVFRLACGVAHQALEEIDPKGDNILIQGTLLSLL